MIRNVFLTIGMWMLLFISTKTQGFENPGQEISRFSGYQKIENTQVPIGVLRNISSKFKGYHLDEAFVSGAGMFRLALRKKGKTVLAYFKSSGEFIKHKA